MTFYIQGPNRSMTTRKATQLADADGAVTVGVIIRTGGKVALVEGGAVRWLSEDALWRLMHPTYDTTVDMLEPPV